MLTIYLHSEKLEIIKNASRNPTKSNCLQLYTLQNKLKHQYYLEWPSVPSFESNIDRVAYIEDFKTWVQFNGIIFEKRDKIIDEIESND